MNYRNELKLVLVATFFAVSPRVISADQPMSNDQLNPDQQGSAVIDKMNTKEPAKQNAAITFDEDLEETKQPIRPGQMEQEEAIGDDIEGNVSDASNKSADDKEEPR